MNTSALDLLLPEFQFVERHRTVVRAKPEAIFAKVEEADLGDSAIARILMAMWRIPARLFLSSVPSRPMSVRDFIVLKNNPPHELVRGLVSGAGRRDLNAQQFVNYNGPGFKLVWGYSIRSIGDLSCQLETETRVYCCDSSTKRWFKLYWAIIRPWSGLIRMDLLRIIRLRAEAFAMSAGTV